MKKFYSFLDTGFVKYVPQAMQHLTIRETAKKVGGRILFYFMEDTRTVVSQTALISKLSMMSSNADGIVFFSIYQFGYDEKFHIAIMRRILEMNLELHFSRENISICSVAQLEESTDFILLVTNSQRLKCSVTL
jgi:hypothetical protein